MIGAQWGYAEQDMCTHWVHCVDGAMAMMDQEQKLDPNSGNHTIYST